MRATMGTGKRLIPLTAGELMSLHGLTVEQGLRQGYCIEGHEKEFRKARNAAIEHEKKASAAPWYRFNSDRHEQRKAPEKPDKQETIIWFKTTQPDPPPLSAEVQLPIGESKGNPAENFTAENNKEDVYYMDKNTRITLLLCLMNSTTFDQMTQTEKTLLLTELLYGEKAAGTQENKTKHPGGRPKKAAAPADGQTEGEGE